MKKTIFLLLLFLSLLFLLFLLPGCSGKTSGEVWSEEEDDIDLAEGVPLLESLSIDGGYSFRFSPLKRNYRISLPAGNPYVPLLSAKAADDAKMTVKQACFLEGETDAIASVTLEKDGVTNTYSVSFTKSESVGFELQYDDRRLYVCDGAASFLSSSPEVIDIDRTSGLAVVKALSETPVILTAFNGAGEEIDSVTVTRTVPSQFDLLILIGQSNAAGEGGDASLSDRPSEGTAYLASPDGRAFSSLSEGKAGLAPALGMNWFELTGRKALILPSASTGCSVESWAPGGEMNASLFSAIDEVIGKAARDGNAACFSVCCFWMQGEWDVASGMTAAAYEQNFLLVRDSLKAKYNLRFTAILPVRSSRAASSEESLASGILSDMLPVRAAQYALGREYADIAVVTSLTDSASTENGMMQSDDLNFTQHGYNLIGKDAAENAVSLLLREAPTATGMTLLREDGRTLFEKEEKLTLTPGQTYRITPLLEPFGAKGRIEILFSGEDLSADRFGAITVSPEAKPQTVLMTVKCGGIFRFLKVEIVPAKKVEEAYRPVEYGWRFDGDLEEKNGQNALSRSSRSPEEGGYEFYENSVLVKKDRTVDFTLGKPIRFSSAFDWEIAWRGSLIADSCLFGQAYDTVGYLYLAPWSEALGHSVRFVTSDGVSLLLPYHDTYEDNKETNSWTLHYAASSHTLSLLKNEKTVSEITMPEFDFTVTDLFGRYGNESVNINFAGELDWLRVKTYE